MKGIFVFIVPLAYLSASQADVFPCYGDWCNIGTETQFCSKDFQYCRDCKKIKDECGTASQPMNCTSYCQELAVEIALQEKAKESEGSCLVISMLLNLVNGNVHVPSYNGSRIPAGSAFKYTCDDGYQLEGIGINTCLGNDTWSHTTFPHCFDNSWIGYRNAAITLSIFIAVLLAIIIAFCGIKICQSRKEKRDQDMSRTSSSFENEDGGEPLLTERQDIYNEDETSPLTIGAPSNFTNNNDNDVSNPVAPSAPPAEVKNENEQPRDSDENRSNYHDLRGPGITINNNFIVNNTNSASQQNNGNNKSDTAETGDPYASVPRTNVVKSIDVKMAAEVSNDNNELDRDTNGNNQEDCNVTEGRKLEKKTNGTIPLQARFINKQTDDKGPLDEVATKEDEHSPIKETERNDCSAHIGLNNVTFPKSDMKGNGKHIKAERDGSLESATKESEQDESSLNVGFSKVTFQRSDVRMNELKADI